MQQIYDMAGLLPYVSKDERMVGVVSPLIARLEGRYRDKSGNYHFAEILTRKQRVAVLRISARSSKPELAFGSGRGSEVLRSAKRRAAMSGWRPLRL
ncbi:MAG: hypothetical protein KA105_06905 [Caulobacter sp.]|nr:hypothetical protein [Caulobacter sp.]